MTEKEWDEDLVERIKSVFKASESPNIVKGGEVILMTEVIQQDRKHQKSEMLKRLPTDEEMEKIIDDKEFPDDAAKAIRKLIKEKNG